MKNQFTRHFVKVLGLLGSMLAGFSPAIATAQVAVSINVNYVTDPGQASYYIQVPITTTNAILTYYEVDSPNTNFQATYGPVGGQTNFTFAYITQFTDLIDAITNGNWTFITDVGSASQKTYYFHITASGFTSNSMPPFQISNPMPGQANVSSNIIFAWAGGPTDYSSLYVDAHNDDYDYYDGDYLSPTTLTSWTPDSPLSADDNNFYFDVNYSTDGSPFLTISTPTTTGSQPLPGWSAASTLNLNETVQFTTSTGPVVTLISEGVSAGDYQFAFTSVTGFTNQVQYTTNLVTPSWQVYTNIAGDGSLKTVLVPIGVSQQQFFRVSLQ